MTRTLVLGFVLAITSCTSPARGDQARSAVIPQDPSALGQVKGFLASFAQLTGRARQALGETELRAIGTTDRAMQTIGFHNIPLMIEGTILKQQYELTQARYHLVLLNRDSASSEDVDRARRDYAAATRSLQMFWDSTSPVD
jgi:hypothetical protein